MDRLSELPDSLILHILEFISMNDVVRTMVLSKKWKTLWSTTACLTFDDGKMGIGSGRISADRFRNFVNRALALWKGSKIVKFTVIFLSRHDQSLYKDVDLWVGFAVERGVEHLHVDLQYPVDVIRSNSVARERMYLPPQCLYSCSSLHQLQLTGCHLEINGNAPVQWLHLKKLCIDCFGVTQPLIDQVLAGSPNLERFELYVMESHVLESLSIQSSSLRYLRIENYYLNEEYYAADYDDFTMLSMDAELRICTPNLETLKICGGPYSKYLLMNASLLATAALRFYIAPDNSGDDHDYDYDYDYDLIEDSDLLGEKLIQILPAIQHVVQLKLSSWCIKGIGSMEKKYMPPNLKFLKLYVYSFQDYDEIVRLLVNFPKLEKLVLQPEDDFPNGILETRAKTKSLETRCHHLPDSFLLQLSRVKVTWTDDDDSIFPFIEILLKRASNLQKLVFRVQGQPTSSLLAAQKLLRMLRSSPHCTLDFL